MKNALPGSFHTDLISSIFWWPSGARILLRFWRSLGPFFVLWLGLGPPRHLRFGTEFPIKGRHVARTYRDLQGLTADNRFAGTSQAKVGVARTSGGCKDLPPCTIPKNRGLGLLPRAPMPIFGLSRSNCLGGCRREALACTFWWSFDTKKSLCCVFFRRKNHINF